MIIRDEQRLFSLEPRMTVAIDGSDQSLIHLNLLVSIVNFVWKMEIYATFVLLMCAFFH